MNGNSLKRKAKKLAKPEKLEMTSNNISLNWQSFSFLSKYFLVYWSSSRNRVLRQMERAAQNSRTSFSTIHFHTFCLTLLLSLLLCKLQNTEVLYFLFRLISGQKHSGIKDMNETIVIIVFITENKIPQI